jgi:hypothetical protein
MELLFVIYLAVCGTIAWTGDRHALPLIALMMVGFGYVGLGSMGTRRARV